MSWLLLLLSTRHADVYQNVMKLFCPQKMRGDRQLSNNQQLLNAMNQIVK